MHSNEEAAPGVKFGFFWTLLALLIFELRLENLNSLLVLQKFTKARKIGNILLTSLKVLFDRHSSEYSDCDR